MRLAEGGWGGGAEVVTGGCLIYTCYRRTERGFLVEKGGRAAWTIGRLLRPPAVELNHSSAPHTHTHVQVKDNTG